MDLDYRETMALAIWGCPDYGMTVMRLAKVAALTVDPDMRSIISGLYEQLINCSYRPDIMLLISGSTVKAATFASRITVIP